MMIAIAILALIALLILWLVLPRGGLIRRNRHPYAAEWRGRCIAHRGLHDALHPENSLAAFENTIARGYAIELDVRLTRDGNVIVLHDNDIERVCGVPGLASELTLAELAQFTLGDSRERIPTLKQALELIAGRTALLIELKPTQQRAALGEKVRALLDEYQRAYPTARICVQAFDPFLLNWFRKHAPGYMRAVLVATAENMKQVVGGALSGLAMNLLQNVLARPDMISYETGLHSPGLKLMRWLRVPLAVWTVRETVELERALQRAEAAIFEFPL